MSQIQSLLSRHWPKYVWVLPFLVISPMAFLIPNDVFTQYPWARTYTDWLAQWIPMIDHAASLHPHPDKFRTVFAYAWSLLPVFVILLLKIGGRLIESHMRDMLAIRLATTLSLIPLSVWMLWLIIYAPAATLSLSGNISRQDLRAQLYTTDFGLLFSAPLQVWIVSGFIVVIFYIFSALFVEAKAANTPGQDN